MKYRMLLAAAITALSMYLPASAEEAQPVVACKREITRYYWWDETAERPEEGYLAIVKWDLPTDGAPVGSCTATYQLTSVLLKTVAVRDMDCVFTPPSTAFCSKVITGYAEARFYGGQSANFISDSETGWFFWSDRILLPVGATPA